MLFDIFGQFNGRNNGDFSAAYSVFRHKGWKSNDQMRKAIVELKDKGWIVLSRQGGMNKGCNLYAVTWLPIDECEGKLHISATAAPLGYWKEIKSGVPDTVLTVPPHGAGGNNIAA